MRLCGGDAPRPRRPGSPGDTPPPWARAVTSRPAPSSARSTRRRANPQFIPTDPWRLVPPPSTDAIVPRARALTDVETGMPTSEDRPVEGTVRLFPDRVYRMPSVRPPPIAKRGPAWKSHARYDSSPTVRAPVHRNATEGTIGMPTSAEPIVPEPTSE